jgi:hypothetical protein
LSIPATPYDLTIVLRFYTEGFMQVIQHRECTRIPGMHSFINDGEGHNSTKAFEHKVAMVVTKRLGVRERAPIKPSSKEVAHL